MDARMKAFWSDGVDEVTSDAAREVDLRQACLIWSDDIRGLEGNFLGLIDPEGRTVQFYSRTAFPIMSRTPATCEPC